MTKIILFIIALACLFSLNRNTQEINTLNAQILLKNITIEKEAYRKGYNDAIINVLGNISKHKNISMFAKIDSILQQQKTDFANFNKNNK